MPNHSATQRLIRLLAQSLQEGMLSRRACSTVCSNTGSAFQKPRHAAADCTTTHLPRPPQHPHASRRHITWHSGRQTPETGHPPGPYLPRQCWRAPRQRHLHNMHARIAVSLSGQPQAQAPFHSSAAARELGIIAQLTDISAGEPILSRSRRHEWEVIEFHKSGLFLEAVRTSEGLGLHPRDVVLFAAGQGGASMQRATITTRGEGMVLFRTEIVRAIIYADKAVLFPCKRSSDTLRCAQRIATAISHASGLPWELRVLEALLAETGRYFEAKFRRLKFLSDGMFMDIGSASTGASSFELQRLLPIQRALTELKNDVREAGEAIAEVADNDKMLAELCLSDTQRVRGISPPVPAPVADAPPGHSDHPPQAMGEAPSSRPPAVSATRNFPMGPAAAEEDAAVAATGFVGGRGGGVDGAGGSNGGDDSGVATSAAMAAQRQRHRRSMSLAAGLLESYENKIRSVEGAVKEMEENIDSHREIWTMQMDSIRNRLIRVNLVTSIASFSLMTATVPAAYFGMNLHSGWEDASGMMWPVMGACTALSVVAFVCVYGYWRHWPNRVEQARAGELRGLRDLLTRHSDDLGDILALLKDRPGVNRAEFARIVRSAVSGAGLTRDEVNVLYSVFDTNRDGALGLDELLRADIESPRPPPRTAYENEGAWRRLLDRQDR